MPAILLIAAVACKGGDAVNSVTTTTGATSGWACTLDAVSDPDFALQLGCWDDFSLLASDPIDASIPGARSVKTVLDRVDSDALYFQNSVRYPLHWDFASAHLSGNGLPYVSDMATFNATEYTSPDRRFVLGAVTFYEEPNVWAYELSPYDTATADLIATAYLAIQANAWFGADLYFHPTSSAIEVEAENLPDEVAVISTDELFAGITYQPLNLGTSMGKLVFYSTDELEESTVSYREIVVLDGVPNDIAVVSGIITAEFQTPLSHINVLSQNRGTPNMALREATTEPALTQLEGKWVELTVDAMDWSIREVTQEEADAWWEASKPDPIVVTPMDTSVSELILEEDILDLEGKSLSAALTDAIPRTGGKGAHYGGLAVIGDAVPHPEAFVIPMYWYDQHMHVNGLWDQVDEMLADPDFLGDAAVRSEQLAALREAITAAPVDPELLALVEAQIRGGVESGLYPSARFRFRSSTNAEDTSGFNGAGLYSSMTGDLDDDSDPIDEAIAGVWASVWSYRATDERSYYSIVHTDIGMALLCHRSFPDEEANGVAITANIYDTSGLEPAFYVNVQEGEESVVAPEAGVTSDQFLYYYDSPGQPVTYLAHSSLVPEGETVLDAGQIHDLGEGLDALHGFFLDAYGSESFYAMDVEFKFDVPAGSTEAELFIKQARPYPGWNAAAR